LNGNRHYLDHNATTSLRVEARDAMVAAMDLVGAASSVHAEGRAASALAEVSRQAVADLVGALPSKVIFVSGATEANNLALTPHWSRGADHRVLDRCLIAAVEHPSVLNGARFSPDRVETMPVDEVGRADIEVWSRRMAAMRAADERPLVSLMLANNETGVMQPVADIARLVRQAGGLMHSDAAQAAGKVPIAIAELGVDALTVSAHKLGGPAGIGALVLGADDLHLADPLIRGGGQERGNRAGTENLVAIAGFGAAAAAARRGIEAETAHQLALREQVEAGLRAISPNVTIFGKSVARLANTVCFAEAGIPAETALIALDLKGYAVSSGSACSSGKVKRSHVLAAMGVREELAEGAIRVSVGRTTSRNDVEAFLATWKGVRDGLYGARRARAA
jgi:cysteine desulfurase